jgi:RecQ family ATP-dependent DNA helicase
MPLLALINDQSR